MALGRACNLRLALVHRTQQGCIRVLTSSLRSIQVVANSMGTGVVDEGMVPAESIMAQISAKHTDARQSTRGKRSPATPVRETAKVPKVCARTIRRFLVSKSHIVMQFTTFAHFFWPSHRVPSQAAGLGHVCAQTAVVYTWIRYHRNVRDPGACGDVLARLQARISPSGTEVPLRSS